MIEFSKWNWDGGKYICLSFPAKPAEAFRILAFGIFVTHFRFMTGTQKHCCGQLCPTVVSGNYEVASYDSKPETEMETDSEV